MGFIILFSNLNFLINPSNEVKNNKWLGGRKVLECLKDLDSSRGSFDHLSDDKGLKDSFLP